MQCEILECMIYHTLQNLRTVPIAPELRQEVDHERPLTILLAHLLYADMAYTLSYMPEPQAHNATEERTVNLRYQTTFSIA